MAELKRAPPPGPSRLERFLRPFTDVRRGEGPTALMMLASVYLILAAYYFVKPAREGLLAATPVAHLSETELKAYSSLGQSLLLLAAIPLYDRIADMLARRTLVTRVTLFFASNLIVFWALQPGLFFDHVGWTGIAFYLWVGMFNVFIVAQFWGFAADLYSDEAGRRLFPMIAIGGSAGAVSGAWAASRLTALVGTYSLLPIAAALLIFSAATLRTADRRGSPGKESGGSSVEERPEPPRGLSSGGLALVFRTRYLLAIAFLILVLNWVNANGENLLFGAVESRLHVKAAAQGLAGTAAEAFVREHTTRFYGDLFFWVNLCALVLQSFVASRVLRYGGFAAILLISPLISLVSYSAMALLPVLAVIRMMKIAENSTDYSLNNTAKQILWLPTTRAMKYKAKAAIDTIFVRVGDVLAAATAFAGTRLLQAPTQWLFAFNASLAFLWLGLGVFVVREHGRLSTRSRERKAA